MDNIIPIKILNFFIEHPYQEVYLRELAKKLRLSPFAIKKYLDLLLKENLIIEERKANLRYFKADISSLFFKHLKIAFNMKKIVNSGLISHLLSNLPNITSIILFGSTARGEDDIKSDLDILIIGKNKSISLNKFEEKIAKEINIHIFSWSEWNKEADNNKAFYFDIIANGIPLYGEIPLVK